MNFSVIAIGWFLATIFVYAISNYTRHGPDGMAAWLFVSVIAGVFYSIFRK